MLECYVDQSEENQWGTMSTRALGLNSCKRLENFISKVVSDVKVCNKSGVA